MIFQRKWASLDRMNVVVGEEVVAENSGKMMAAGHPGGKAHARTGMVSKEMRTYHPSSGKFSWRETWWVRLLLQWQSFVWPYLESKLILEDGFCTIIRSLLQISGYKKMRLKKIKKKSVCWHEKTTLFMKGIWLLQHLHGCPRCNFVDWCGGVVKTQATTWLFAARWILPTDHTWDVLQGVWILPCALQPLQVCCTFRSVMQVYHPATGMG